jgi:putative PIN family toxin of toxin-antitoxin system
MRVVYDTSVLATLLSRRDQILWLQREVSSNRITLITSPFIMSELETALSSKFGLTKQGGKTRTRLLARVSVVVQPTDIAKVARDTNDDMILATAVEGEASYLITLDKDLLVLKEYRGILIVTPTEFSKLQP